MNNVYRRHEARRILIVYLRRQGLTIREIAEQIGKPQKVVKWHIHKIEEAKI
jgi:DNA-directed RNA polymerase specialized sigma24 family protein